MGFRKGDLFYMHAHGFEKLLSKEWGPITVVEGSRAKAAGTVVGSGWYRIGEATTRNWGRENRELEELGARPTKKESTEDRRSVKGRKT